MARKRTSLQTRIILVSILVSLFLILTFSVIQVKNQLNTVTAHHAYRVRLTALFIKTHFEKVLEDAPDETQRERSLKETAQTLLEQRVIENITLYKRDLRVLVESDSSEGRTRSLSRLDIVSDIVESKPGDRWFYPVAYPELQRVDLYLPLVVQGQIAYVFHSSVSLRNFYEALQQVYIPVIITAVAVLLINSLLGIYLSQSMVRPIKILNQATQKIASGDLRHRVKIKTRDEIETLAETFNNMTVALVQMKERAENANPLTKLPGNNVIREEIERRIARGEKWVVVHADIDNFKAYNDKYGFGNGDKVIQKTAGLLKETLHKRGTPADFLGHEGGDDFVFVTSPEAIDAIAAEFSDRFNQETKEFYPSEDRGKGYILEKNRQGVLCKFPLMTISMAGVSNLEREIKSYAQVSSIAAEVKEKAKSIGGTCFVMDKRKDAATV